MVLLLVEMRSPNLGFKHRKVTPLWPEANGEVERFIKTFGKVLRTTTSWKQQMYQFLRNYRATAHCTTSVTPATALFERPVRIKLPCPIAVPCETDFNTTQMRQRDAYQKLKMKSHAECMGSIRDLALERHAVIAETTSFNGLQNKKQKQ